MNILIPDSWLREYLETKATPKQLKDCLSLCGPSIERINKVGNDIVYDIEITSNRVDMASVYGIAREAAAILPRFGIKARLLSSHSERPEGVEESHTSQSSGGMRSLHALSLGWDDRKQLPLTIQDPNHLCNRLLAVVLDNVSVASAPEYIRDRVEKSGIRSLNNLVDITNYVMMELGHPSHVFDYDRIKTNTFIIRNAKKGEKIITLDNKEYSLSDEDIIIDDGTGRVIDLPGIMGTENSVVTKNTKRIIFFIESNNPVAIRKSSMRYGIRTVAATINEKHPDPELAKTALLRGIELYQQVAGAQVRSEIIDIYPKLSKPNTITVTTDFINERLGVELRKKEIVEILKSLSFDVKKDVIPSDLRESRNLHNSLHEQSSEEIPPRASLGRDDKKIIQATPPTFRQFDVTSPEDIVEEVARIYGYHNLPGKLMTGEIPVTDKPIQLPLEQKIKTMLKYWGFTEIYAYSFISKGLIEKTGLPLNDHLKLKNPLTEEIEYMRASLLPSMLETIEKNQHSREHLSFFELSNAYIPQKGQLPEEKSVLMIATTQGYKTLKGVEESLFEEVGISDYEVKEYPHQYFHPNKSAAIFKNSTRFALLGVVHPNILSSFNIKKEISVAAIRIKELGELATPAKRFQPVIPFPLVIEDLTLAIPPKTQIGKLIEVIRNVNPLVRSVELVDSFESNVSLRITYQHSNKNLTSEDVGRIREALISKLQTSFKAKLKS